MKEMQEDDLRNTIMSAVVNGIRQYKRRGGEVSNADGLIKHVTASVTCMLTDKGMGLADVAVRLKMEQLERDLKRARKNKLDRVH